jgi:transposase
MSWHETSEGIFMGKRHQLKYEIVCKYEAGQITCQTACKLLGISDRTLRRYVQRYKIRGLGFVRHGNRGRKPANTTASEIKEVVQRLMREVLYDFNMTHAREKIESHYGLKIPRETMRRWCHEIGMVKQKHRRRGKPRIRRDRMTQPGLLVQFDGSHHEWYEGEKSCLLAAIDDATSEVLWAELCEGETTVDCLRVLKTIVEKRGVFKALYVDRAGLYGGMKRQNFSQVSRALEELGTHVIFAQSPEGKGRVERLFRTLQDRLIPELRVQQIKNRKAANHFLQKIYLPDHNNRYSKRPESPEIAFKPVPMGLNLEDVFCQKEFRQVARDHTFSLMGQRWMISDPLKTSISDQVLEIRLKTDGRMEVFFAGRSLRVVPVKQAA